VSTGLTSFKGVDRVNIFSERGKRCLPSSHLFGSPIFSGMRRRLPVDEAALQPGGLAVNDTDARLGICGEGVGEALQKLVAVLHRHGRGKVHDGGQFVIGEGQRRHGGDSPFALVCSYIAADQSAKGGEHND
jgi:hypothetical protein